MEIFKDSYIWCDSRQFVLRLVLNAKFNFAMSFRSIHYALRSDKALTMLSPHMREEANDDNCKIKDAESDKLSVGMIDFAWDVVILDSRFSSLQLQAGGAKLTIYLVS